MANALGRISFTINSEHTSTKMWFVVSTVCIGIKTFLSAQCIAQPPALLRNHPSTTTSSYASMVQRTRGEGDTATRINDCNIKARLNRQLFIYSNYSKNNREPSATATSVDLLYRPTKPPGGCPLFFILVVQLIPVTKDTLVRHTCMTRIIVF